MESLSGQLQRRNALQSDEQGSRRVGLLIHGLYCQSEALDGWSVSLTSKIVLGQVAWELPYFTDVHLLHKSLREIVEDASMDGIAIFPRPQQLSHHCQTVMGYDS